MMIVSGRTVFDGLGRTVEQYYPVTEPIGQAGTFNAANDERYHTKTEFDVLDRTVKTTLPDGTVTTMAYGFGRDRDGKNQFQTVVTDANNSGSGLAFQQFGVRSCLLPPSPYPRRARILLTRDTDNPTPFAIALRLCPPSRQAFTIASFRSYVFKYAWMESGLRRCLRGTSAARERSGSTRACIRWINASSPR